MKIVKIHGGLGNQMFQFAFALRLVEEGRDEVFIDLSGFEDSPAHNGYELARVFGVSLPEAPLERVDRLAARPLGLLGRLRRKYLTPPRHFIDRKFGYQPELLELGGDRYFEGYWQSEKYFAPLAARVRASFAFARPLDARNEELLAGLPRPTASVHVRRGDYAAHENLDICGPAYFREAMRRLREAGAASFLVFSDEPDYCREALGLDGSSTLVDWNRGRESWQDMAMMARCDHHVIANSSFSWWGAWLGEGPDTRTIAPRPWNRRELRSRDRYYAYSFADIVPERWERISA